MNEISISSRYLGKMDLKKEMELAAFRNKLLGLLI